jgi:hypothetical protein
VCSSRMPVTAMLSLRSSVSTPVPRTATPGGWESLRHARSLVRSQLSERTRSVGLWLWIHRRARTGARGHPQLTRWR